MGGGIIMNTPDIATHVLPSIAGGPLVWSELLVLFFNFSWLPRIIARSEAMKRVPDELFP